MSEIILKKSMKFESASEKKQISSIRKLGDYNTEDSKKLLIETLSTLNSFVRDEVVNSLVKIGDIDFLCENIDHKHRYVRRGIVQALGQLGGPIACEQIIKCFLVCLLGCGKAGAVNAIVYIGIDGFINHIDI